MTVELVNVFLRGALTMSAFVAGLFFLRFWSSTRDRLFVFFALAFWLLAFNWLSLALVEWEVETRHRAFFLRLFAFVLILVAIVDKNRRAGD